MAEGEACQICEVPTAADGGEEKEIEKKKQCYMLPQDVIEKVRDLANTLGIDQSEVVRVALTSPKKLAVIEKAAAEVKKIDKEEK